MLCVLAYSHGNAQRGRLGRYLVTLSECNYNLPFEARFAPRFEDCRLLGSLSHFMSHVEFRVLNSDFRVQKLNHVQNSFRVKNSNTRHQNYTFTPVHQIHLQLVFTSVHQSILTSLYRPSAVDIRCTCLSIGLLFDYPNRTSKSELHLLKNIIKKHLSHSGHQLAVFGTR